MSRQLTLIEATPKAIPTLKKIERDGSVLAVPEALDTIEFTHGLHRFPGKFIPQIPRYIIRHYLEPNRVMLDPFCGSGTSLIEAALDGRPFVGLDIDPLSVLVSKAKTYPLSPKPLEKVARQFDSVDWSMAEDRLIPAVHNLGHWFTQEVIVQLSALKARCVALDEPLRTFALVLFSSIIRRVSNADDQTQKTYVSHTHIKKPTLPRELFPIVLQRAVERMAVYSASVPAEPRGNIQVFDTRQPLNGFQFDDVVTSPPYIDSIDYVYNQMLEYFWLLPELGIDGHEGYRKLRKRPMGMCPSDVRLPDPVQRDVPEVEAACCAIEKSSPKEASVIRAFFQDYQTHVENVRCLQGKGGYYITVAGNSLIRGRMVPTADALVAIHRAAGYKLNDRFTYIIKRHYMKFPRRSNSGKIVEDNVLVFTLAR